MAELVAEWIFVVVKKCTKRDQKEEWNDIPKHQRLRIPKVETKRSEQMLGEAIHGVTVEAMANVRILTWNWKSPASH